jgi:hypothetical protein
METLSAEQRDFIGAAIEETLDRAADHLDWLVGPDGLTEPDREAQIAATEALIELGRQTAKVFSAR